MLKPRKEKKNKQTPRKEKGDVNKKLILKKKTKKKKNSHSFKKYLKAPQFKLGRRKGEA